MVIGQEQKQEELLSAIAIDVVTCQGSATRENYTYLERAYQKGVHTEIIEEMQALYGSLCESTDLNYDRARVVSFLGHKSHGGSHLVWFSFVARYVALFCCKNTKDVERKMPDDVLQLLADEEYYLVPQDLMHCRLPVFGKMTIWNALFSELEFQGEKSCL